VFKVTPTNGANEVSIRVDKHFAAYMPRRRTLAGDHRAECGGFVVFLEFGYRLVD
jgi:hypothetical protein